MILSLIHTYFTFALDIICVLEETLLKLGFFFSGPLNRSAATTLAATHI
jgi:hypothetical protein